MNKQEFLENFNQLIAQSKNILITSHKNPDDDSIGSVLSLYQILTDKYSDKNFQIIYSTLVNQKYNFLENFDKIKTDVGIAENLNQFDLIVFLDLGRFSMFSDSTIQGLKSKIICIDHHGTSPDKFDLAFIDPQAVATCQIIYDLFCNNYPPLVSFPRKREPIQTKTLIPDQVGDDRLDASIARSLFLGISGDSRNFEFVSPSESEVFSIAAKLVKIGQIDVQDFLSKLYSYSENIFKIIQELVKNSKIETAENWPDFFNSFITPEFIKEAGFSRQELDQATHIFVQAYATAIDKAAWGFVISPDENEKSNISIRSRSGSINVRKLMENLKVGGGHDQAAGGTFKLTTAKECLKEIKKYLAENKPEFS